MTKLDLEERIEHCPRTVHVAGLASEMCADAQGQQMRCQAVQGTGKRCTSHARWWLSGTDGAGIAVCRAHANAGEKRGQITIEGEHA